MKINWKQILITLAIAMTIMFLVETLLGEFISHERLDITCKQFYGKDAYYAGGKNQVGGIRCIRELKQESFTAIPNEYRCWETLPIMEED